MKFVRPVVRTVGSFSGTVRDVNRFREVAVILAKYGLGILVSGLDIPGLRAIKENDYSTTPQRVTKALQELGPTFIKFGQILSTRPDIVSPAYIEALQSLQDDVQPLDFSTLESSFVEHFGHDWRGYFQDIDETPLATASIAQVHRAILHDGRQIVCKVRRPKIVQIIESDLHILKILLERFLHEFPEMELFDPRGMFNEFQRSIVAELDFDIELRNLIRFRKSFFHVEGIVFPEPIEEMSSNSILCMEYLKGIPIRKARENGCDMEVIGERYIDLAYTMLFDHGFFHGDLHPGNILIMEGDVIGVLDCGMVGRLTREMKDQLATLIFALYRGDNKLIAQIFFDISIKEQRIDYMAFERDAIQVAEKHWSGGSFADMDIGAFLMDLTTNAIRHKVYAPTAFTMFFKGVLTTEGLAKSLLPEVDPLKAAQPYVETLIKARWQPETWQDLGTQNLLAFSALMKRLPISLTQLIDDIDYQRLKVSVEHIERKVDQQTALRRQGLLVLGLFSLGWMGLAATLLFVDLFYFLGIPFGFLFCMCFALLLQIGVVYALWRSYAQD